MACGMSLLWSLLLFWAQWVVTTSQHTPGTVAVRWEFFPELRLSWNEASRFCRQGKGHLPTVHTPLAIQALGQLFLQWSSTDAWMGLHSARSGAYPNVWEKDCSLQSSQVHYWSSGEPNNLNTDLCNRLFSRSQDPQQPLVWRTMRCSMTYTVVCEYDLGNCDFEEKSGERMTSESNAILTGIRDVTGCWAACLAVRSQGKECVAAELRASSGQCRMWMTSQLLVTSQLSTLKAEGYTLMVRKCFESAVNSSVRSYDYSNKDNTPQRAAGQCSPEFQEATYTDYLPPGLLLGAFPHNVTLQLTSSSLPPSVTPSSVDVDVSTGSFPQSSSWEGETARVTSSLPFSDEAESVSVLVTSSPPFSDETESLSVLMTSYSPFSDETESLSVLVTSSLPFADETESVSVLVTSTSPFSDETQSLSVAVSSFSTASAVESFSSVAQTGTTPGMETSLSVSSLVTSLSDLDLTTTTSTGTVTEEETGSMPTTTTTSGPVLPQSEAPAHTQPPPNVSTSPAPTDGTLAKLCPCKCRSNSQPPPTTSEDYSGAGDLIPVNTTSRYKRSKTSVYISRPFDVGVGVVFVTGSFAPILAFMCCDCYRLLNHVYHRY